MGDKIFGHQKDVRTALNLWVRICKIYDEIFLSQICDIWPFTTRKHVRIVFFSVRAAFYLHKQIP